MPVKLNSSGGGSVTLDLGSTGSTYTQTLPLINGSLVAADSSGNVSVSGTGSFTGNVSVSGTGSFTGNVAIGGATVGQAGYRLALQGYAASSVPLYLHSDATNAYLYSPNPVYLGSTGANPTVLVSNNAARFTVGTSGQLGIGVSPSYGSAGQVLVSNGASSAPSWASTINANTAVASNTNQSSISFTGIPSWAKRITVMFNGVSTSAVAPSTGTSPIIIQLGRSAGVETTGYASTATRITGSGVVTLAYTTGFAIDNFALPSMVRNGIATICLLQSSSNAWTFASSISDSTPLIGVGAGHKALSGTLTQILITTVSGSDTFDAGLINILYE